MPETEQSRLRVDLLIGLGLRGASAVASFILTWLIAQIFGARTVGLYQIGVTTASLFATVALLGQEMVMVRKVAPLLAQNTFDLVGSHFCTARAFVMRNGLILWLFTSIIAVPIAYYLIDEPQAAIFIIAAAPMIAINPVSRIQNAMLRCNGQVIKSQSLEGVVYTTLTISWVVAAWLLFGQFPAWLIVLAFVSSQAIVMGIGHLLTRSFARGEAAKKMPVEVASGARIAASPALIMGFNWLLLIIITASMSAQAGGIFRTAFQISSIMMLVSTSFGMMAGPYIARAVKSPDAWELRKILLTSGGIGTLLCLPLAAAALIFPHALMGLFGEEFITGASALQIMAIGELVWVAGGPTGIALIMQGRERQLLWIVSASVALGIGTALLLLPTEGLAGAALGMLTASVSRVLLSVGLVWISKRPAYEG